MDNTPAFPANHFDLGATEHGMTLRDYFAAKAMSSSLVNATLPSEHWPKALPLIADFSYKMADAMMEARK
jgi:hypothetical protein